MKNILLLISFVLLCTTSAFAAPENDTTDIVISQKALLQMSDADRNAVFEGLKKQAKLQETVKNTISPETIKNLTDMDVETFKGKTVAIADTLVLFFDKLGVKANEFINTPVGLLAALGIIYKIGVFQGIWSSIVSIASISIFLTILYQLNTKKIISTAIKDENGTVIGTKETVVPKFSAIASCDTFEQSVYSIIGSIVCVVVMIVVICSM